METGLGMVNRVDVGILKIICHFELYHHRLKKSMKKDQELIVITKTYDLILWSCNHTSKFPRNHRFVLGERIERNLYGLLETLIAAKYTKNRQRLLEEANLNLEILRFQMRLAKDLQCLKVESYAFAAKSIDEIGRLVGGWLRSRGEEEDMKRYGNLWDGMISFENLLLAAHAAARGKRFKPGVARFLFDLERQLLRLHEELAGKTYRPGPYRTFTIYEGKTRQISAAPFRDRVVHHALTGMLEPIFERSFSSTVTPAARVKAPTPPWTGASRSPAGTVCSQGGCPQVLPLDRPPDPQDI